MINLDQSIRNYICKFWISAAIISVATEIMIRFFWKFVFNTKFVPLLLSMFFSYLNKLILMFVSSLNMLIQNTD